MGVLLGGGGVLRGAGSRHPTLPKSTAPEHEVAICDDRLEDGDYNDEVYSQNGSQVDIEKAIGKMIDDNSSDDKRRLIDQKLFQFGTLRPVSISSAMSRYFQNINSIDQS